MRQGLISGGLGHLASKHLTKKYTVVNQEETAGNGTGSKHSNSNGDNINLYDKAKNPVLYGYTESLDVESNVIKIGSHSSWSGLEAYPSVSSISDMLYEKSPTWRNYIDNGQKGEISIEFHACKMAINSSASAFKFSEKFKNVNVYAVTNNLTVQKVTLYKNNWYGKSFIANKYNTRIENGGSWIHIKNGIKIKLW